jgi:hypothetical protein
MTRVLKRHFGYDDAVAAPANIVTTCFYPDEKNDSLPNGSEGSSTQDDESPPTHKKRKTPASTT